MKKILKVGYPVAIQSLLFTIIAIIVTKMQNEFGYDKVTTQRLGSQIEAVAWMIASGFQVALASFVGQNYAAGRIDRVKEGYIASMKILVPYGIIVNVLMFVFARQIFGAFLSDPTTIEYGQKYLEVLSFSQLFMILELSTAGAFNGLGKTKYPSTVSILGNILRIPGAMLLSIPLAYVGIWWAISISSIIKGIILVALFVWYFRRLISKDESQLEIA
jgi:Na+-driven multidrug efflux pump